VDAETLIWTLIFFGGTVLIVAFLFYWSWKKDREKRQIVESDELGD
jgi:hypothetical protein